MVLDVGSVLTQWQSAGVFDYLLPFLLIFAVIYGILSSTNILGGNRGIQVIIAIVIGMMALQFTFVPELFRQIFPRLGVGLAVLVSLLILIGLFFTKEDMAKWGGYILMGVGFVIFIIIIAQAFENFGAFGGLSGDYAGWVILAVLFIGIIIAVASSGDSEEDKSKHTYAPFRIK